MLIAAKLGKHTVTAVVCMLGVLYALGVRGDQLEPDEYIAHAGGAIMGTTYTSSLEAIDLGYQRGLRFIELDFDWTTDSEIVLLHGWDNCPKLFNMSARRYSLSEFKKFKMIKGLTPITLDDLALWLKDHSDAYIVTDFKERNIDGLHVIARRYPHLISQFIPQIYTFDEYEPLKVIGFKNIIVTLYVSQYPDEDLIKFVSKNDVFAVTMPLKRAFTSLPNKLRKKGVYVYTHTVNDLEIKKKLNDNFVNGIYTDYLAPDLLRKIR